MRKKGNAMPIGLAKKRLKQILQLKNKDGSSNHMPILLWSSPGIGKSSICKQIAEELKWEFIDIRLPLLMPSDLMGLPYPDDKKEKAKWLYPDFFPDPKSTKNILILFDEIGNASMSVQNSCYRIILEKSVGEHYKFPEGVKMVAASNREIDKSGVGKFSAALANRFIHFDIEADKNSWKMWALQNDVHEKIIGFINFKETMLCKDPKIEDKAYPTPRSWHFVSDLMNAGIDDEEIIAAAIGVGTASEFFSYIEVYSRLPDIDKILKGDKSIKVPSSKDPSTLYALASSLTVNATKDNIENIFNYCKDMPTEFHVLTIRDITRKERDIFYEYPKYQEWLDKHNKFYGDDTQQEGENN